MSKRVLTFNVTVEVISALDEIAESSGLSRSWIVDRALADFVARFRDRPVRVSIEPTT